MDTSVAIGICILVHVWLPGFDSLLLNLHGCTTFLMFIFYLMVNHIVRGISL